ncbi:hypothetical protein Acr_00g0007440 [Actinidia rufa]|uniref:CCHC-type domain-containing protein n=1 Tax=Actinidia rufa TaxID=165716 RepID=A0A7J0D8C5_9ERIC|nr:hypothetical protein Acr_00g0007440 [Actinidia rufa]
MNRKTIGLIRQCIGHEVFHHVAQETSAYELWIKLEEMYQAKTYRNKALLMRRLVNLKLQRETTVAEHTSEFQMLNRKLTTSMVMDALFNEEARRREMGSTDQSESQALVSEGSRERGRGQGRELNQYHKINSLTAKNQETGLTIIEVLEKDGGGHRREVALLRCFYCDQEGHIKRDCPKYKAQDQSSDTAATAVMVVDESDVLLAASEDGNIRGNVYGWRTTQLAELLAEGQSGSAWQTGDSKGCSFEASGGILRVSKGNKKMLWGKKTRGLYRLEGNVQTGGATVRHGSSGISKKNGQGKQPLHRGTQSKRRGTWRIHSGTRAQGDALGYVRKFGQTRVMQPVQDVHREAQRKETKSILRSCTAKGAATPKRVSFALDLISGGVLSSCAHK